VIAVLARLIDSRRQSSIRCDLLGSAKAFHVAELTDDYHGRIKRNSAQFNEGLRLRVQRLQRLKAC
jgi:hypothetical protein